MQHVVILSYFDRSDVIHVFGPFDSIDEANEARAKVYASSVYEAGHLQVMPLISGGEVDSSSST